MLQQPEANEGSQGEWEIEAEEPADGPLGSPAGAANNTKFLAPVINPTKIVCAPVNYEAHITESEADPGITFNHAVARIDKAGRKMVLESFVQQAS